MFDYEFLNFSFFSVLGFFLKIFLSFVFNNLIPGFFYINYFFVHFLIIIIAYLMYSVFTFKTKLSLSSFFNYFKSVFFLKVIDYFFTNFLVYTSLNNYILAIFSSSFIIHVLRFFFVKNFVF